MGMSVGHNIEQMSRTTKFGMRLCLGEIVLRGCLLLLLVLNINITSILAQEGEGDVINREGQIKAAYIYQFGRYVEWPPNAFSGPQSPFIIGVFSEGSVTSNLSQLAQSKKIQDRSIEIRRCTPSSNFALFHILFLPASLKPEIQTEIIRQTAGKNVLLVGEESKFLTGGGDISFVTEENNIRLHIARKAIEQQGLNVSSKLLQVGKIVD